MANSLNMDLTDKTVILSSKVYRGDERERTFLCQGGFGCRSFTMGGAIIGIFISDGEKARIQGWQIEKLADPEHKPPKPNEKFKTRQLDL